jgi:phage shock protein A
MDQHTKAASQLEQHLIQQRKDVLILRQKLTDFEAKIQEAYTQKQLLLARNKAAGATIVANQIIDQLNPDDALSELKILEQKVVEREAQASKGAPPSSIANLSDHSKTLADAITTLQLTIDAIARLEKLIAKQNLSS